MAESNGVMWQSCLAEDRPSWVTRQCRRPVERNLHTFLSCFWFAWGRQPKLFISWSGLRSCSPAALWHTTLAVWILREHFLSLGAQVGSEIANWREAMENETASSLCAMGAAGKAAGCNLSVTTLVRWHTTMWLGWTNKSSGAAWPGLLPPLSHPPSRQQDPAARQTCCWWRKHWPWPVAGARCTPPLALWSNPYSCTPCCLLAPMWQLPSSELMGTSPVGSLRALQLPSLHLEAAPLFPGSHKQKKKQKPHVFTSLPKESYCFSGLSEVQWDSFCSFLSQPLNIASVLRMM